MRDTGPVTTVQHPVPAGSFLVSRTNPNGVITSANDAFVAISGFSREELLGQPHNILRHPDMPPQAFADLWQTITSGRCWVGAVKNRSNDGGYYWVRAAVAPVMREGRVTEYVSVRVRLPEDERLRAEGPTPPCAPELAPVCIADGYADPCCRRCGAAWRDGRVCG